MIDLIEWNNAGVFAFIDLRDSSVYVSHSSNMLLAMVRLLPKFKGYDVKILETTGTLGFTGRLLVVQKYLLDYKDAGFTILNRKIPLKYKVDIQVVNEHPFRVHVVLVSRNKKKKVVGVFKKYREAIRFLEDHYSGDIINIIYARNELTKSYIGR